MYNPRATTWTPRQQIRERVYWMRKLGYRWTGCYRSQGTYRGLFAVLRFTWEGR